ncbi:hypothetical protein TNCV_2904251 [Trichonephila clavipes]|nr:hypothetical protein TNCV_2904251 [Trichonephila clavipes]
MLPGSSTSLTALFHGCESHLKLLECVVDGTGEVVLASTTPAEERYIVYQQGTGAPQLSRWQISFLLPLGKQISRKTVARNLRGGGIYARRPVCVCPIDQTAPYCPFAMVS